MSDCKTVRLGDVATYINGYAFKPSDWGTEGLPIIRIQNLTGNDYETNFYNGKIPEKYFVKNGDVLISWSASLGVYEWKKNDALLNQHIFKVVFDKLEVDKKYFMFTVSNLLNAMSKQTHGSTMRHITKPDFDNMPFPLPPIEKQKQIARKLDKCNELILKNNRILEKYDLLIKSRFIEMFGDPSKNPMNWKKCPVIEEADCMVPGRDKPKSFTGNIPWITIDDLNVLNRTRISKKGLGLTVEEINEVKRETIPEKSVIMSCVGNLGICSIADVPMIINQQLHSFQCKSNLIPEFLMYCLTYQKPYMESKANFTTVAYMNKTTCNSIPIIVPPLELQIDFATFVQQIDKSKFEYTYTGVAA